MKKIVIVGAGYSGILTAKKLAKKFKRESEISVTIIDKNPFHTMLTELHEVAAGRVDEDSIKISFKKVFAGRRIQFVHDMVESVDFKSNTVICKDGKYDFDYVVIAAGSRPTFFGVPGADVYAHTLWSYEDAIKLKDRILNCFRQASVETDIEKKKKLLSFYVVGAGFTGAEMIGELAEYVPILCDKFEINRDLVTLCNVDFLSRVVPNLPEKLSNKIQRRLEKMGVNVILNRRVVEIGEDFIDYEFEGNRSRHLAGTVIWVAGIESSDVTTKVGGMIPSQKRGRLDTDRYLRSPDNEHVYITGDNLFYIPDGETMPVPQMVENCEQSAETVAHNIYCSVTGNGELEAYKPKFHGVMVCIGGRYGAARVGTSKNMVNLPSFLAMFVKHFINVVYFVQVLGWNKVFSYIKHEFFTIRNKRSFVGGHFSNRTPSFLLVALRVWLGAVWLFEGVMKIVEGWLKAPKLEGFFGAATNWFNSILGITGGDTTGAAAVSDAMTSATTPVAEAGEQIGKIIINWDILGIFKAIFVSGKPLAESSLADYAFKLDIPALNWFMSTLVIPHDGIQLAMQIFIVFAEILIGLSLIGGLFTTPSSAFSIILLLMFTATTGLYLTSFWMIFGAIALIFGAGSIFGLDYYTTPLLKRGWRNLGWVRRLYIYHD